MSASWSSKMIDYFVRMVDTPRGEEGLNIKKGMDILLYFYEVQNYQPQKKAQG